MKEQLDRLRKALADRYAIERELGRGGMATVYLARDLKHDRLVALKLLRPELGAAVGPERFLLEIRVTARLQHPHLLPLLDSGTFESQPGLVLPYYVMPYVQGESLRDRLDRQRQLPVEEAVRIAMEVAEALGYAHSQGVVHRDIKPENILLSAHQPVLADFGIARAVTIAAEDRLTETGLALGTPQYMSPEQAAGERSADARADLYALGCVLYEMLAGDPPFTGSSSQAVIARHLSDPVPPLRTVRPAVSEELERAVNRALAKAPGDRFASAEDFASALSESIRFPLPSGRPAKTRWRSAVILALIVAGSAAGFHFWSQASGGRVSPSASLVAVLPFNPSGADTGLSRLGRDLVFTLSAELDGLGGIRVVDAHTMLAQVGPGGLYALGEGTALARRFGAGSVVHGSLVREGANVRLDFTLLPTDTTAAPLARGSVTGLPDSIAALTDSTVRALLGEIWTRGPAPTPSLDVALKTRSVPALRAFLTGEGELVGGESDSAATWYGRAIQADPSFWLAYARFAYARNWSLTPTPDSIMSALEQHRLELPDRERMTTEVILFQIRHHPALARDRGREVSERYPDSWFGWLIYGDELAHNGPLSGYPQAGARAAIERAVELNPNLIPGWEHLTLLALLDHDTALVRRSLGQLQRLGAGPVLTADGYGNRLLQFRFLDAAERGDTVAVQSLSDSVARDPAPLAVGDGSFYDAFRFGFSAEQIRVSSKAVEVWSSRDRRAQHRRFIAFSWAARGAWDSALAVMDRLVSGGTDSLAPLKTYGLAVVGNWLGALGTGAVTARRGPALASVHADRSSRAELAWLDGLHAYVQSDRKGLERARTEVRESAGDTAAALGSLNGLSLALGGDTKGAADSIAGLEWREAAEGSPGFESHPWAIAVDRLEAARWLSAAGNHEEAARLLTWVDGPFLLHPSTLYNVALAGLVNLERGRIEERQGHHELASRYYREFLRRYDRPMPSQQRLVEEARVAIQRIEKSP